MNPPRIVLLIACAACALAAIVIWRVESSRTAAFEDQVAQLKAENAKLSGELAAATEKAGELEAESAQLRAARAISGTRLDPAAAAVPEASKPKDQGGFLAKMFRDPQMRKLLAAQQAAALRTLYSAFLKEADLSPDETERFYQLLDDRQMALMDSSARAMSGGAVDMNAATAAANAADEALKDLLGPARFGQYQEFEKTLGPRVQVQQFNQQLAGAGYPLQDFQSTALIHIMSDEKAAMPGPGTGAGADADQYSQQVDAVNQRIYARAKSVLTAPQLSAFATFQKNLATSQVAGLRMAQQMLKGGQ
jgi:hypothetical protein